MVVWHNVQACQLSHLLVHCINIGQVSKCLSAIDRAYIQETILAHCYHECMNNSRDGEGNAQDLHLLLLIHMRYHHAHLLSVA